MVTQETQRRSTKSKKGGVWYGSRELDQNIIYKRDVTKLL